MRGYGRWALAAPGQNGDARQFSGGKAHKGRRPGAEAGADYRAGRPDRVDDDGAFDWDFEFGSGGVAVRKWNVGPVACPIPIQNFGSRRQST